MPLCGMVADSVRESKKVSKAFHARGPCRARTGPCNAAIVQRRGSSFWCPTAVDMFAAFLALVGVTAGTLWMASTLGVSDSLSDDELLRKLAGVAREGSAVLCEPAQLQKRLPIRIADLKSGSTVDTSLTSIVSSGGAPGFDATGTYSGRRAPGGVCSLRLRFQSRPFCETDSARVQRLVGARVEFGLNVPGGADRFDHGYVFDHHYPEKTIMGWRGSARSCLAHIEIVLQQA